MESNDALRVTELAVVYLPDSDLCQTNWLEQARQSEKHAASAAGLLAELYAKYVGATDGPELDYLDRAAFYLEGLTAPSPEVIDARDTAQTKDPAGTND